MSLRPASTVRGLLYLLAGAVILPMAMLLSYNVWQQYHTGRVLAQAEALRLAQLTADTAETFIKDARGVLTTLARRPQMLAKIANPEQPCDEIFPTFKEFYPQLSNMSLSTPAGVLVCSSLPQPGNRPLPVAHMAWFQQVYQRQDFVVGPIVYGPINKNWISVLAEPVRDGSGKMVGALQTPIDLLKFRLMPAAERLPPQIFIFIVDIQGNVIARSREAESYVGRNLLDKSEILRIAVKQRQGTAQSMGIERIPRFYGFTPVAGTDWIAIVGIDVDYALAGVTRSAQASALAAAGIVVLVLLLAVALSRRIARPIQAVSLAARQAGAGGLDVRLPTDGPRELAEVAREFNLMLDAIGDTQARLQHSQSRLELASQIAKVGGWELDIATMRPYWSPETCRIHEVDPSLTPPLDRAIEFYAPEAVPTIKAAVQAAIDHGTPWDMELPLITAKGRPIWVRTQCTCVTEGGKVVRLVGAFHDITERKRAESERELLERELREAHKMESIGTLAGGIAHDFNNILATILGNTALARSDVGANPDAALESLEEIQKAARRARDLVQQILSFSRRSPTEKKPIELTSVVEESARLLRATLPGRLKLRVNCAAGGVVVLGDQTQILQVLINLATNAMQAMRDGPGCINIFLDTLTLDEVPISTRAQLQGLPAIHPEHIARLVLSDDGPGMDAATLERIFEPFFTTKPPGEGTGLGLSVVHGIVQSHGGAIEVQSALGRGTTFTICLPVAKWTGEAPNANGAARAAASVISGGRNERRHILYLDDDKALVSVMKRLLERRGYRVSSFDTQDEALAALRAAPDAFDVVVTDYNMPGMSGLDVARAVRTIRADLPVAVASGFVDVALRENADQAGVRDVIFKADDLETLCAAVQRLIEGSGKASQSASPT